MGPEMAAIIVPVMIFLIPIIAILTSHQQKMAKMMHQSPGGDPGLVAEVARLRQEMESLKEIVHSQALAMDDQATLRKIQTEAPPAVPSHLNLNR